MGALIGGKKEPGVLKLTPRRARLSRVSRECVVGLPRRHAQREIAPGVQRTSVPLVNLRTIGFPVENLALLYRCAFLSSVPRIIDMTEHARKKSMHNI